MSYGFAAAGTGGHVFPALAVAEQLVEGGVSSDEIVFIGGDRIEAEAVPAAGYSFVGLELRGLKRSLSLSNLGLPFVVIRAARRARSWLRDFQVKVLYSTGGYVAVPVGWAARREGVPYFLQEPNAEAGLANRIMSRGAAGMFTAFQDTGGLPDSEWTGHPIRSHLTRLSRTDLRQEARAHYGLDGDAFTLGVVGGSLGAALLNEAVARLAEEWAGDPLQIVHLAGRGHGEMISGRGASVRWSVVEFEERMELFFAAADVVVARAGGMVAEITATGTPAILVPGGFGSRGHQVASAASLERQGAALVLTEEKLGDLPRVVKLLASDPTRLSAMSEAALRVSRPEAAHLIADRLRLAHD